MPLQTTALETMPGISSTTSVSGNSITEGTHSSLNRYLKNHTLKFSENPTTECTGSDCSAGGITPTIGAAIGGGLVLTLTGVTVVVIPVVICVRRRKNKKRKETALNM